MYYDIDSAVLKVPRIDEKKVSVSIDREGLILAVINLPFSVKNIERLDCLFYQIWSRICFDFSCIVRNIENDRIDYMFITGTRDFGYKGRISFIGTEIVTLLAGPSRSKVRS
jgi:hypothetical protein